MTEARIKRPEAEGVFFSMAKISFRNTSGLTKVPMSSAALIHCKKEGKMQRSGNMATARAPTGDWAYPQGFSPVRGHDLQDLQGGIHPPFSHGGNQGKWDPGF